MKRLGLTVVGIVVIISLSGCGVRKGLELREKETNLYNNFTKSSLPYDVKNTNAELDKLDSAYIKNKQSIKYIYTDLERRYGGEILVAQGDLTAKKSKSGSAKFYQVLNSLETLHQLNELYYKNKNYSGLSEIDRFLDKSTKGTFYG